MAHYICTGGCDGVSDHPGICKDPECANYNQPLEECRCPDGEHYGAFNQEENDDDQS